MTYSWTSNKFDTVHALHIWNGAEKVTTIKGLNGSELKSLIDELKANGYAHKAN